MADARSKYLGKKYGQVKVPTVKVNEKETTKNFIEGWKNSALNLKTYTQRKFKKNVYKKLNNN